MEPTRIDGSYGEGGGQILRTTLAISLATGRPVVIENVRRGRRRPGLMRQHLTAVQAATEVGRATTVGAEIGSTHLEFRPSALRGGEVHAAVGTAGSAVLVAQTLLPALLVADAPSTLRVEGGTHNPGAPPFDYLEVVLAPLLRQMGAGLSMDLDRPGFYPAGGGAMTLTVTPSVLTPIELVESGPVQRVTGRIWTSALPLKVAERERKVLCAQTSMTPDDVDVIDVDRPRGPGNVVLIRTERDEVTELFTAFGEHLNRAEHVARVATKQYREYRVRDVPVGPQLADQLLLPMALAGGGRFRTGPLTEHTRSQIHVIERLLPIRVRQQPSEDGFELTVEKTT